MDILFGIEIIKTIQSVFSPTLDGLFIGFTLFGESFVYLSLIAIMYWCFNKRVGVKTAYILLVSAYLNHWLKLSFSMERPPSEYRLIQKDNISYGFPSGHTQSAVTFWGWIWFTNRSARTCVLFVTFVFVIGLSRIYLGVHYLGDVLGGLFFGAAVTIGAYKTAPYLESKVNSLPSVLRDNLIPLISILLFGVSLVVFPDTTRGNSALVCGTLSGFSLGVPLESKRINIPMNISRQTKAIRAVVGLITVFGLYLILSFVINLLLLNTLILIDFLKYMIVAFSIPIIAPLIFKFIKR